MVMMALYRTEQPRSEMMIMTDHPNMDPTGSQFGAYSAAYDYFNDSLFGDGLPRCMLNFSRKSHRVLGFFAPERRRMRASRLMRSV